MTLTQDFIRKEFLLEDLGELLNEVDMDFTGFNGEEYFAENNLSYMENAINESENLKLNDFDKIDYIINACIDFSKNFYEYFEYTILDINTNSFLITIATKMY